MMASKIMILLFIAVTFTEMSHGADTKMVANYWDGVSALFAVSRERVQQALQEHYPAESTTVPLYIPPTSVYPEILDSDEQAIYLGFGYNTIPNFGNNLSEEQKESITASGNILAVGIALLTDNVTNIPKYGLAIAIFYQRNLSEFVTSDIIFPLIPVDEIRYNREGFYMRNGTDELEISAKRSKTCEPVSEVVRREIDSFTYDFQFGANMKPNFEVCDNGVRNHYCDIVNRIEEDIKSVVPNVCQREDVDKDIVSCGVPLVRIENISKGFGDILMIDAPKDARTAESLTGLYTVELKYPCVLSEA